MFSTESFRSSQLNMLREVLVNWTVALDCRISLSLSLSSKVQNRVAIGFPKHRSPPKNVGLHHIFLLHVEILAKMVFGARLIGIPLPFNPIPHYYKNSFSFPRNGYISCCFSIPRRCIVASRYHFKCSSLPCAMLFDYW